MPLNFYTCRFLSIGRAKKILSSTIPFITSKVVLYILFSQNLRKEILDVFVKLLPIEKKVLLEEESLFETRVSKRPWKQARIFYEKAESRRIREREREGKKREKAKFRKKEKERDKWEKVRAKLKFQSQLKEVIVKLTKLQQVYKIRYSVRKTEVKLQVKLRKQSKKDYKSKNEEDRNRRGL